MPLTSPGSLSFPAISTYGPIHKFKLLQSINGEFTIFTNSQLPTASLHQPTTAKVLLFMITKLLNTLPIMQTDFTSNNLHTVSVMSNSSGIESSVMDEDTTNLLEKINVFDLNGNAIPISDLWKDRRAVVAFARHFGCVLCRKRADYLAAEKDKMDAAGVSLVLIGPASVDQAKVFSEQTKFKGEVYADPSHASYEALQFISGVTTTFTPGSGLKIIKLYMEGYRQDWGLTFEKDTRTTGAWKQGGILVAGPGKTNISYLHKDKEAGDDPPIEEILKACCT